MTADRKRLYAVSVALALVLVSALFIPRLYVRIVAAALSAVAAVTVCVLIKKRSTLSIDKNQVFMIMSVMGVLYVVIYYLTGLEYGFYRTSTPLSVQNFLRYILPIATIIVSIEIIRGVMLAQKKRLIAFIAYIIGVVSELIINAGFAGHMNHSRFMDIVAMTLFPALISNLLYNHISARYGKYPNISYRIIIGIYSYILPMHPSTPDVFVAFANSLLPLAVFGFIKMLYTNRNQRYAIKRGKRKWLEYTVTAILMVIMISIVMLISCQFRYGMLVIATESMTGEINKGDAIVYEAYDDQIVTEGQVIAFRKDNRLIVHRVTEVQRINGRNRYYTKGDANDGIDSGYITDGNIEGVVLFKVSYIGYPTIWLRELFK